MNVYVGYSQHAVSEADRKWYLVSNLYLGADSLDGAWYHYRQLALKYSTLRPNKGERAGEEMVRGTRTGLSGKAP